MIRVDMFGVAEDVGFEPTGGFPPLVFKASAINRTLPIFLLGETGNRTLCCPVHNQACYHYTRITIIY